MRRRASAWACMHVSCCLAHLLAAKRTPMTAPRRTRGREREREKWAMEKRTALATTAPGTLRYCRGTQRGVLLTVRVRCTTEAGPGARAFERNGLPWRNSA